MKSLSRGSNKDHLWSPKCHLTLKDLLDFILLLWHDIICLRILNIHFANFGGEGEDFWLLSVHPLPSSIHCLCAELCCRGWPLWPASPRLLCYWLLVGSASGRHWQWLKDGGREGGVCVSSSSPPALSSGHMSSQALPLLHGYNCHWVSGVCITSSLYPFRHQWPPQSLGPR